MRIAVGADEQTPMTDAVIAELRRRGHEPDLSAFPEPSKSETDKSPSDPTWPAAARAVAEAVAAGTADEGILFCWTGTGVSIAANKVPGIRAALCGDAETARGARLWNNANVLCLSLRRTSEAVAREILDAWFDTSFVPNDTDNACLAQLEAIEQTYRQ
ncbi:MAG: RpiB/LacA/LacB family sugar-phosphate isomerase [Candidatus Promineofilum sp.]|nr:RpiB/LacA/LacB family sugar-phosphate isomerase [Promineifilum sp.]